LNLLYIFCMIDRSDIDFVNNDDASSRARSAEALTSHQMEKRVIMIMMHGLVVADTKAVLQMTMRYR